MTKRSTRYKTTVMRMTPALRRKAMQRALDREISLQRLLTDALEEKLKRTTRNP
jgi:predicted HicB family RNase H-like nuclease